MAERPDGEIGTFELNESDTIRRELEPWRKAGAVERLEFLEWLSYKSEERQTHGQAKYGIVFQGNPIQQGIEENIDQLFYLYWAQRHLDHLHHLLEAVMEFGITEELGIEIYATLGVQSTKPCIANCQVWLKDCPECGCECHNG